MIEKSLSERQFQFQILMYENAIAIFYFTWLITILSNILSPK